MNKATASLDRKGKYSIRLAARMAEISPDTLRVWERRYGAPKPARTAGGGRLYSDADIALLRLVARGIEKGYRPQELLGKRPSELEELLRAVDKPAGTEAPARPALASPPTTGAIVDAAMSGDSDRLRSELRRAALALGPRPFVVELCQPLLEQVGELWSQGKLAVHQEHLVSDAVTTQLRVLLSAYDGLSRAPVIVLTTLPGEQHALGILMVALQAAVLGAAPRLLGPSTPVAEIGEAAHALAADVVGVSVTRASDPGAAQRELRALRRALPARVRLWVGGAAAEGLDLPGGAERMTSWSAIERGLALLR